MSELQNTFRRISILSCGRLINDNVSGNDFHLLNNAVDMLDTMEDEFRHINMEFIIPMENL